LLATHFLREEAAEVFFEIPKRIRTRKCRVPQKPRYDGIFKRRKELHLPR
jgi:hypothetical protein